MTTPFKAIAERGSAAHQYLTETIAMAGEISLDDAHKVAELYLSKKMVRLDYVIGRPIIKYGELMEQKTIRGALASLS